MTDAEMLAACPGAAAAVAQEKAQQRYERIRILATLLASFDDVIFRTATARDRAIYLDCAAAAMDAAHKERMSL